MSLDQCLPFFCYTCGTVVIVLKLEAHWWVGCGAPWDPGGHLTSEKFFKNEDAYLVRLRIK
jgi:hypothetical protein